MNDILVSQQPSQRLADHLESLQEGFFRLSRAAGLNELAGQFASDLRDAFPHAEVSLLHRELAGNPWTHLAGKIPGTHEDDLLLPGDQASSTCTIDPSSHEIRIVQRLFDSSYIGLALGNTSGDPPFSDIDAVSLRLFLQVFDNAYRVLLHRRKEKDLIFSMNHRVLQLNSLIDTGIEVAKLEQSGSLQQLALERAASLANASRGVMTVTDGKRIIERIVFPAGAGVPRKTEHRIKSTFKFGGKKHTFELFEKESRNGTLSFEETDQLLLDALARQVHASLENRRLHQLSLEKQKIDQDIAVAASIQQRILPKSLPAIEGYDLAGVNIPSRSVGGDYYDCIPLPDGRFALIIADVSGKGIPAALLVSSLHAYLSAYLEGTTPLVRLAQRLNTVIARASTDDKFITAFFALLTPATGDLETLNAGHNPAYLMRTDGSVQELAVGGVALGMLDIEFPFQTEHVTIGVGERLLLYTDGITEATNERNQLYDSDVPLKEFALRHSSEKAKLFVDSLINDIRKFTGNAPQSDDITAMYLVRF